MIPQSTFGIILNKSEELLFVKSRRHGETRWHAPGGKVDDGEEPDSALVREVMEELGLTIDKRGLWQRGVYLHTFVDAAFQATIFHAERVRLDKDEINISNEVIDFTFMSLDDIERQPDGAFTDAAMSIINEYRILMEYWYPHPSEDDDPLYFEDEGADYRPSVSCPLKGRKVSEYQCANCELICPL